MVELIGTDPKEADYKVDLTNGAHARLSYLVRVRTPCAGCRSSTLAEQAGDIEELQLNRDYAP
jgi:hypothetical protein